MGVSAATHESGAALSWTMPREKEISNAQEALSNTYFFSIVESGLNL
jgi:hypothetical protein